MLQLQVKQFNNRGQISIGKKYAGKKVEIDEYPDGSVILRPIEVIREFEMQLMTDSDFQGRLDAFDRWERENPPAETNLEELEKRLDLNSPPIMIPLTNDLL